MDLLTPGVGLIFWQLLIFGILFLFLSKYAWGPITKSLKEREKFISDSIKSAEKAEKELGPEFKPSPYLERVVAEKINIL